MPSKKRKNYKDRVDNTLPDIDHRFEELLNKIQELEKLVAKQGETIAELEKKAAVQHQNIEVLSESVNNLEKFEDENRSESEDEDDELGEEKKFGAPTSDGEKAPPKNMLVLKMEIVTGRPKKDLQIVETHEQIFSPTMMNKWYLLESTAKNEMTVFPRKVLQEEKRNAENFNCGVLDVKTMVSCPLGYCRLALNEETQKPEIWWRAAKCMTKERVEQFEPHTQAIIKQILQNNTQQIFDSVTEATTSYNSAFSVTNEMPLVGSIGNNKKRCKLRLSLNET